MNNLREKIVKELRECIDTPFIPQACVKRVGFDCVNLVFHIAKTFNFEIEPVVGYSQTPSNGLFEKHANEKLNKITFKNLKIGDLLVFKFLKEAQHIAFVSEVGNNISIIHANSQVGKTVEHILDFKWERRIVGCYRIKELEKE